MPKMSTSTKSWTVADCVVHADAAYQAALIRDRQEQTQESERERRIAQSALGFIRRLAENGKTA